MRETFLASGLFSWQAVTANASRGDVYLDESPHTAMELGSEKIAHFTGSETRGIDASSVDIDAMARAVIRGDYGNGDERKQRLGSYYSIVQRRVNELLA